MKPDLRGMILAGVLALAALAGSSTAQQADDGPPLLPGEVYIPGPEDCGVVANQVNVSAAGGRDAFVRTLVSQGAFNTPCEEGLLHGQFRRSRFHHGRLLLNIRQGDRLWSYSSRPGVTLTGDDGVAFFGLEPGTAPTWPTAAKDIEIGSWVNIVSGGEETWIRAWRTSCNQVKAPVRGCNLKDVDTWFSLYAVQVEHRPAAAPGQPAKPSQSTFFVCPDHQNSAACEGVWRTQVARYQPRIEEIIARARLAEAETMRQLDDLHRAQDPEKRQRFAAAIRLRAQQRAEAAAKLAADQLAARQRAEEEAAAEAAKQAKLKADAEAAQARTDADFRQKLATGNAGTLYALADELAEAGDAAKAREVLRTLVSRFPDHALAAAAAQRLPALGSSSGGASGGGGVSSASTASSSSPARYSSVCARNMAKAEDVLRRGDVRQSAATYDLWLIRVNDIVARLYQPCIAYDEDAARDHRRAVAESAKIRQYCAMPRGPTECLEWGYAADRNRNWFNVWNGEMQKAFADPNYSADMGTARGPGGTTAAGTGAQTAGTKPPGGAGQCASTPDQTLERFNAEMAALIASKPMKPEMGTKATYQWSAYIGTEALKRLEPYRQCLGRHLAPNENQLKAMRDDGLRGCAQTSNTGQCTAEYPY